MISCEQSQKDESIEIRNLDDGDFVVFEYNSKVIKNAIRSGVKISTNNGETNIESDDATYTGKEITRIIKVIPFKEYSKVLLEQVQKEFPEEFL